MRYVSYSRRLYIIYRKLEEKMADQSRHVGEEVTQMNERLILLVDNVFARISREINVKKYILNVTI